MLGPILSGESNICPWQKGTQFKANMLGHLAALWIISTQPTTGNYVLKSFYLLALVLDLFRTPEAHITDSVHSEEIAVANELCSLSNPKPPCPFSHSCHTKEKKKCYMWLFLSHWLLVVLNVIVLPCVLPIMFHFQQVMPSRCRRP